MATTGRRASVACGKRSTGHSFGPHRTAATARPSETSATHADTPPALTMPQIPNVNRRPSSTHQRPNQTCGRDLRRLEKTNRQTSRGTTAEGTAELAKPNTRATMMRRTRLSKSSNRRVESWSWNVVRLDTAQHLSHLQNRCPIGDHK